MAVGRGHHSPQEYRAELMPAVYMRANRISANLTGWCNFISSRRWSQAEAEILFLEEGIDLCHSQPITCLSLPAVMKFLQATVINVSHVQAGRYTPGLISHIKQCSASVFTALDGSVCITAPPLITRPSLHSVKPVLSRTVRTQDTVRETIQPTRMRLQIDMDATKGKNTDACELPT